MTFNFAMQAIDQPSSTRPPRRSTCRAARWAARSCSAGPTARRPASARSTAKCYASWYAHVPGLKVVAPYRLGRRDGAAAGGDPRPQPGDRAGERDPLRPELRVPDRPRLRAADRPGPRSSAAGAHVTIVAFSIMVGVALKAAEILAAEGIEAEVINLRSLRPLDTGHHRGERQEDLAAGLRRGGAGRSRASGRRSPCRSSSRRSTGLTRRRCGCTASTCSLPYAANLERLALPQPDWVIEAVRKLV